MCRQPTGAVAQICATKAENGPVCAVVPSAPNPIGNLVSVLSRSASSNFACHCEWVRRKTINGTGEVQRNFMLHQIDWHTYTSKDDE